MGRLMFNVLFVPPPPMEDSSDDLPEMSYKDDFVVWMVTEWTKSCSSTKQQANRSTLWRLESGDFLDALIRDRDTLGEDDILCILDAWAFIHMPKVRTLIAADPELANYVPYGILRIQEDMMTLSALQPKKEIV